MSNRYGSRSERTAFPSRSHFTSDLLVSVVDDPLKPKGRQNLVARIHLLAVLQSAQVARINAAGISSSTQAAVFFLQRLDALDYRHIAMRWSVVLEVAQEVLDQKRNGQPAAELDAVVISGATADMSYALAKVHS